VRSAELGALKLNAELRDNGRGTLMSKWDHLIMAASARAL
jgi:arginine/ornithine N-succinyltransferase beta subunit